MLSLETIFSVGKRYNIAFNAGLFLSNIDNRPGICLNINDMNFGFLTRNIVFDNEIDLEKFFKKYMQYLKNSQIRILLDDYEESEPTIYYSEDLKLAYKQEIEKQQKANLWQFFELAQKTGEKEVASQLKVVDDEKKLKEKAYQKLEEYKKMLYQYYDKNYVAFSFPLEEEEQLKENIIKFQTKLQVKIESIAHLSAGELKIEMEKVLLLLRDLEINKDYLKVCYDSKYYQRNIELLDKMMDFLQEAFQEKRHKEIKLQLEKIKSSFPAIEEKEKFINDFQDKVKQKYQNLNLNDLKEIFKSLNLDYKEEKETKNKIAKVALNLDLITDSYQKLTDYTKQSFLLYYSPLRKIFDLIIEMAQNNQKVEKNKLKNFLPLYNHLKNNLNKMDNLIIKLTYFSNLDFTTFESFFNTLIPFAKALTDSHLTLPQEIKLFSLDLDKEIIPAYIKALQLENKEIKIVKGLKDSTVIYSPKKLIFNLNDDNLLELVDNKNIFYLLKAKNKFFLDDLITKVIDYKPVKESFKINGQKIELVVNLIVDKEYNYQQWEMKAGD